MRQKRKFKSSFQSATEKQIKLLRVLGADEGALSKLRVCDASKMIEELINRPTTKQKNYAKSLGATSQQLQGFTKETIGAFIDARKSKKRYEWNDDDGSPF